MEEGRAALKAPRMAEARAKAIVLGNCKMRSDSRTMVLNECIDCLIKAVGGSTHSIE